MEQMSERKQGYFEKAQKLGIVIIGGILAGIGMNLFLIPANVYASGFAGLAQLLSRVLETYMHVSISTGTLYILFNIPIVLVAWKQVGKSFTFFSFLSIVFTTLFLEMIPVQSVSDNIILNAVFGGVIVAIGTGLALKWGASTGGLDIIAMIVSHKKGKPIGTYFFLFNAIIILCAGALFGWEKALYTLVSLYASTRVIDTIHTRYVKLTAFIVTQQGDALRKAIQSNLVRGITTVPAMGAYTNSQKELLMIVFSRYELYELMKIIQAVDPRAFTNVVHTESVFGLFRKD